MSDFHTQIPIVLDIPVEERESSTIAVETMVQTAFDSEEFFFLGESVYAVVGDELLINCLDALAACLVLL